MTFFWFSIIGTHYFLWPILDLRPYHAYCTIVLFGTFTQVLLTETQKQMRDKMHPWSLSVCTLVWLPVQLPAIPYNTAQYTCTCNLTMTKNVITYKTVKIETSLCISLYLFVQHWMWKVSSGGLQWQLWDWLCWASLEVNFGIDFVELAWKCFMHSENKNGTIFKA